MSFPIDGLNSTARLEAFKMHLDRIEEIYSYELSDDNTALWVVPNLGSVSPRPCGTSDGVHAHSVISGLVAKALHATLGLRVAR